MAKKSYFAQYDDAGRQKRREQRPKNGYIPGAHRQDDSIGGKNKRIDEVKQLHQKYVSLYTE
jgi:hypothetical protein